VDLGKAIEPMLRGVGRIFIGFDSGAVVGVRGEYVKRCRRADPPGPVLYSTPLFIISKMLRDEKVQHSPGILRDFSLNRELDGVPLLVEDLKLYLHQLLFRDPKQR